MRPAAAVVLVALAFAAAAARWYTWRAESPTPPPAPVRHWEALTAEGCVNACKPLPVSHYTPHCSRLNQGGYYCAGESYERSIESVCTCGVPPSTTVATPAPEAPNLVVPVVVHHGLKWVLGH